MNDKYLNLENDWLMMEKVTKMFQAKTKLLEAILTSGEDQLIDAYATFEEGDFTLDEFITKLISICRGEAFKEVIFKYMLSVIAVNEEQSRVAGGNGTFTYLDILNVVSKLSPT